MAVALVSLFFSDITAHSEPYRQSMAERATYALKAARKIKNPDTNEITKLILQEKSQNLRIFPEPMRKNSCMTRFTNRL